MLTLEEIKKIVFGTVDIKEENSWYVFYRMSEKQIAAAEERDRPIRPYATASVRLDIVGKIRKISFDYQIFPGSSRHFYGIDVLENGEARYHIYEEKNRAISSFTYEPSTEGRITIYFPNLTAMQIKNVTIEGDYEPYSYSSRWFVIGDSITQGYDALLPMNSYVNRLMRILDADCVNQAIGGDMFGANVLDTNTSYPAQYALIAYGTNDWSHAHDPEKYAHEFFTAFRKMYPTIPVYYVTPIWRERTQSAHWDRTLEDYSKAVSEIAKSYQVTVIDGSDLVPKDKTLFSFGEALHPNDDGYIFQAQNLASKLRKISPELFPA